MVQTNRDSLSETLKFIMGVRRKSGLVAKLEVCRELETGVVELGQGPEGLGKVQSLERLENS